MALLIGNKKARKFAGKAATYAQQHGIRGVTREPDNTKGYGNALTVDLIAADGTAFSARGRIDEGQMEASRIGQFKARMPLDPGIYVVASYREGPGMAGTTRRMPQVPGCLFEVFGG